ncbi:MAG: hypothetical protein K8S14_05990 [Actinomycetia bacterium]|nr:hypothetical protein [Actinomycetes bacterium]
MPKRLGPVPFWRSDRAAWTWHQSIAEITSDSWQITMDTSLKACLF